MLRTIIILYYMLYSSYLWKAVEAAYATGTNVRMKHKILQMDEELVKDAMAKVYSIQHLKRSYERHTAFYLSEITYKVRLRYFRMVFVFARTFENLKNYTISKLIRNLVEIDYLAMETDKLIDMAVKWAEPNPSHLRTRELSKELLNKYNSLKKGALNKFLPEKQGISSSPKDELTNHKFTTRDLIEEGFDTDVVN